MGLPGTVSSGVSLSFSKGKDLRCKRTGDSTLVKVSGNFPNWVLMMSLVFSPSPKKDSPGFSDYLASKMSSSVTVQK